ncbi:Imm1 family immunity protein [Mycobacterium sp. smrl_JER01]|uniref:Imm1 family immunity protein n=1 Tax=Mycobacterium sp. smrl_JER01 TaxID=3402633 RepID=UPI003AC184F8
MLLRWDDQEVHVNDAEELESRLESLAKPGSAPVLVSMAGSAGALSLGLGHQSGGLLLFADNDRSQPPLHSVGVGDAGGDEVEFARGDATFSFFPRCLVDHGVMVQAAREFFDTGTLPTCVVWEAEPSPATGNAAVLGT